MNEYEQKLSRQSLKEIPGEWRAEILANCRGSKVEGREQESRWPSTLVSRLSTIFWPHPKAWAGLAAAWIFIFALNFSMRETSPRIAEKVSPPSQEMIAELKKEHLMYAELIGARDISDADRSKLRVPSPRTERVEILTA